MIFLTTNKSPRNEALSRLPWRCTGKGRVAVLFRIALVWIKLGQFPLLLPESANNGPGRIRACKKVRSKPNGLQINDASPIGQLVLTLQKSVASCLCLSRAHPAPPAFRPSTSTTTAIIIIIIFICHHHHQQHQHHIFSPSSSPHRFLFIIGLFPPHQQPFSFSSSSSSSSSSILENRWLLLCR